MQEPSLSFQGHTNCSYVFITAFAQFQVHFQTVVQQNLILQG